MPSGRVFVYALARTPFGRFGGKLSGYRLPELGAKTIDTVVARSGVPNSVVAGVFIGTAMLGGGALTAARQAVLRSKLAETTPSLGLDRACCSGMSAIAAATMEARAGVGTAAFICGGIELLSSTPRLFARNYPSLGTVELDDPLILENPFSEGTIASYTSEEALRLGVDRNCQDEWAVESHKRYFAAEDTGFFDAERFGILERNIRGRFDQGNTGSILRIDESPRRDTSVEKLAALLTVRGSTTITAGNAPGLNDGAALLLIGSEELSTQFGCEPLAEIVAAVRVAEGPTSGTRTPAVAIQKVLTAANINLEQVDVIEINEAFAATPLVSTLVLADFDRAKAERLRKKTNPNGGSVAIGHPMGASGARICITLINQLRKQGGGIGVAAICGGFGQGEALLIKVA